MTTTTEPKPSSTDTKRPGPPVSGWLVLLNYLVPGAGVFVAGRRARGLLQGAMVLVTFAIGLALRGGVTWPIWRPTVEGFNLINNLMFLVQLCGGLPAWISLAADRNGWSMLAGTPQDPYFELGAFYLVVAGAINYFMTLNMHDRLVRRDGRFADQEADQAEGLL